MSKEQLPDISNCERAIRRFYKVGYKALDMGKKLFYVSLASIFLVFIIRLAMGMAVINAAIKYHKEAEKLPMIILEVSFPYVVATLMVNLVVSIILFIFIKRTVEMYQEYYNARKAISDLSAKLIGSVGYVPEPGKCKNVPALYLVFMIISYVFTIPAIRSAISNIYEKLILTMALECCLLLY